MDEISLIAQSKLALSREPKPSFHHRAAQICLLIPLPAAIVCKLLNKPIQSMEPHKALVANLAVGGSTLLLCCISLALGLIALFGIPRYGTRGIFLRAMTGMLASGAFIFIMGASITESYQTVIKDQLAKLAQHRIQTVEARSRKEPENPAPVTQAETDNIMADKVLPEPPEVRGGVGKATILFYAEMHSLAKDLTEASQQLRNPPVLDMSSVSQHEQLELRKETVRRFMTANEKLMAFFVNQDKKYRDDLTKYDLDEATILATLRAYHRTSEERSFVLVKIRQTDQQVGSALLKMLDVLDASWGQWKFNPELQTVAFNDAAALTKYNDSLKAMKSARADQKQLQSQLPGFPERPVKIAGGATQTATR